ncbi:MAG TPA: hypothetical protein VJ508_13010, partial [Saprospiraceae bacterium]|nr:hypothetical protein [Saprospiraceae bacterium]
MSRSFPAKMLLFGEYTVLAGSQALAVPLTCWSGTWHKTSQPSKAVLNPFLLWLKESGLAGEEAFHQMEKEFEAGWRFNADIPVGHGVGSSGAYVAAIFDRYVKHAQEVSEEDTASRMAKMEGYFHGTSSGMDPLVSLTQKAVLKDTSGIFHVVEDPGWPAGFEVYLWDSRIDRTTSTLV